MEVTFSEDLMYKMEDKNQKKSLPFIGLVTLSGHESAVQVCAGLCRFVQV